MIEANKKSKLIEIINDIKISDLSILKATGYEVTLRGELKEIGSESKDGKTKIALGSIRTFITAGLRGAMYGDLGEDLLDKAQRSKNLKELENKRLKEVLKEIGASDELEDMEGKIGLAFKAKIKEFGNIK